MTEFIPGFIVTWLAIWMLFAFATNLAYPLVRRLLREVHPATASTLLFAWITLPAFTALMSCVLLFAPLVAVSKSCAGNCELVAPGSGLLGLPALVIGLWVLGSALLVFRRYWLPAHLLARQLRFTGEKKERYIRLHSDTPAAFTLGWLTPTIYLTDGLIEQCDAEDIDCILNHEEAHLRRRDNLSQLITRLFTVVLPNRLIKRQLDDYNLLCEQACDLEATRFQPADEVAGTLLKVARLQCGRPAAGALAFLGDHIEERITSVLKLHHPAPGKLLTSLIFLIALTLTLLPVGMLQWIMG